MKCKRCRSTKVVKNGSVTRWKDGQPYRAQIYICKVCGRTMSQRGLKEN